MHASIRELEDKLVICRQAGVVESAEDGLEISGYFEPAYILDSLYEIALVLREYNQDRHAKTLEDIADISWRPRTEE